MKSHDESTQKCILTTVNRFKLKSNESKKIIKNTDDITLRHGIRWMELQKNLFSEQPVSEIIFCSGSANSVTEPIDLCRSYTLRCHCWLYICLKTWENQRNILWSIKEMSKWWKHHVIAGQNQRPSESVFANLGHPQMDRAHCSDNDPHNPLWG